MRSGSNMCTRAGATKREKKCVHSYMNGGGLVYECGGVESHDVQRSCIVCSACPMLHATVNQGGVPMMKCYFAFSMYCLTSSCCEPRAAMIISATKPAEILTASLIVGRNDLHAYPFRCY